MTVLPKHNYSESIACGWESGGEIGRAIGMGDGLVLYPDCYGGYSAYTHLWKFTQRHTLQRMNYTLCKL